MGKNTEIYIIFTVLTEKEVTRIDKNGEKTINYLAYSNLLTAQGLCQAYHQISSIIFLKEFITLNVKMDTKYG